MKVGSESIVCGAAVVGVEGNAALVRQAQENAARNALAGRASFVVANLFAATRESVEALGPLHRALIDHPREGAIELAKALPHRDDERALARLVYVSCNPATLARDARGIRSWVRGAGPLWGRQRDPACRRRSSERRGAARAGVQGRTDCVDGGTDADNC